MDTALQRTRTVQPAEPGQYYGGGLPYAPLDRYPGKIIAIEGTDGVGRSTQIALLREWLEVQGHGVVETGWTQSELMQPTIELAKASNTLNKLTFVLLYATDFADRLETQIIPALKAGFIVLSDRYFYSTVARDVVRGADPQWARKVYGFALKPDCVFYLKASIPTLITRMVHGRGFNYWESGMDMKLGEDFYDSFVEYQKRILEEFDNMTKEFKFKVLDASKNFEDTNKKLQEGILNILEND